MDQGRSPRQSGKFALQVAHALSLVDPLDRPGISTTEGCLLRRVASAYGLPVLNLTPSAQANELLTNDPFALLVGMLLDQQFPMERAFAGPQILAERLGTPGRLDPQVIVNTSDADLLAAAKGPPAIHRYPGSMIDRIRALAQIVIDDYDGDAARIWTDAKNGNAAVRAMRDLPGFGEQKAKIFIALVGKQLDQAPSGCKAATTPYGRTGTTMSIADVTDEESLLKVRAWKQRRKKRLAKAAQA